MTRIAHITDLHFGATGPAVVAGLIECLNAAPPDLLAVSGDLTQGARRSEFRAAVAFLNAIHAPRLVVPGNHDITPYKLLERFLDPYRSWRQEVSPETQPIWNDDTTVVVGLNTARRAGLALDWSRGRVTASRLRRALGAFERLGAGRTRILVAHHPLLPPEQDRAGIVAGGARRALRALATAGVDLVLAGHLHRSYARLETPETSGPLILQGGSATSTRLRGEPNAFNWITIEPGKAVIEGMVWTDAGWSSAGTRAVELPLGTAAAVLRRRPCPSTPPTS